VAAQGGRGRKDAATAGGSAGVRLFADSIVQSANLRGQGFAEIGGVEHRADLDLARAGHGVGATLDPLHGLGHVLDLPEPETGDELPRLGKGAIDDSTLLPVEGDLLALTGE
jgi:hypothetical protein